MSANPSIDVVIVPPTHDLGDGFRVRRALPSRQRRMVGPFVFFDQMGPVVLRAGRGLDVRPHPHIGLATVTYLFDGEILHRDSLGPIWSKNTNGPTIRHCADGRARRTSNPSPRSRMRGTMTVA